MATTVNYRSETAPKAVNQGNGAPKPYISVRPITPSDTRLINSTLASTANDLNGHVPMVVFPIRSEIPEGLPPRPRARFEEIGGLMEETQRTAITALSYYPNGDFGDIRRVLENGRVYFNGVCRHVEFNVDRRRLGENLQEVIGIRMQFPNIRMILQLSSLAINEITPGEIARRLSKHSESVHYVTIPIRVAARHNVERHGIFDIYSEIKSSGFDGVLGFSGNIDHSNAAEVVERLSAGVGNNQFSINTRCNMDAEEAKAYLRVVCEATG
jgi:hypothetical protein